MAAPHLNLAPLSPSLAMSVSVGIYSPPSSSAAGVVSFLEEEDQTLKAKALEKLYEVVDVHWAEVRRESFFLSECKQHISL